MQTIKEYFPTIQNYTYFNTPGIGLISKDVYEYRKNRYEELFQTGSEMMMNNAVVFSEVREKIAEVYHANPAYISLHPAFSFGFNAILEGLKPGLKILLLKDDYPSINFAVEARDFKISYAEINENLEENIAEKFLEERPEVFIFSQVQYLNGIKIDFSFVNQLKKEYPDTLFIADGTQYLGTEAFDFNNSGIDILGASAYKWLGAGLGNGFFMFKPEVEEILQPKNLGFGSTLGKYKEEGNTLIGKFEGSHLDPANIGSIKTALNFQQKIGIAKIENKVKSLSKLAQTAFQDLGLLENTVIRRSQHSSIFNLKAGQQIFEKLEENAVLCSQRGEGIRVGLHYYNTEKDLEKLLKLLKS